MVFFERKFDYLDQKFDFLYENLTFFCLKLFFIENNPLSFYSFGLKMYFCTENTVYARNRGISKRYDFHLYNWFTLVIEILHFLPLNHVSSVRLNIEKANLSDWKQTHNNIFNLILFYINNFKTL